MDNIKIGMKLVTLTRKMKRFPDERHIKEHIKN